MWYARSTEFPGINVSWRMLKHPDENESLPYNSIRERATSVGLRFVKLKHMLNGSSSSEGDVSNIAGITA